MSKISLIKKLEIFADGKRPHWQNGGEFERLAMNEGYKASNASRRCRELVKAGIFERREVKGSVEYRLAVKDPSPSAESKVEIPLAGVLNSQSGKIIYRPEFLRLKKSEAQRLIK